MKKWALLMACLLISGARAQNDQASATAVDKAAPVHIQGEPVHKVGGGVIAPRAVYAPDPEYSEEARRAQLQGTCALWVVVGADGKTHDVRIARSLGLGLDEKSIEAIQTWRFDPATKNGQTVAVANACFAAAIVCSTSFSVWAALTNAASNCDGGK